MFKGQTPGDVATDTEPGILELSLPVLKEAEERISPTHAAFPKKLIFFFF